MQNWKHQSRQQARQYILAMVEIGTSLLYSLSKWVLPIFTRDGLSIFNSGADMAELEDGVSGFCGGWNFASPGH